MNPYQHYVSEIARLVAEGRRFQPGGFQMPARAAVAADAPRALVFSPHPDDECIIGGLAFCTLYRIRRWRDGRLQSAYTGGRSLPANVNAATLFA